MSLTALVIDDISKNRQCFEAILLQFGFKVMQAQSAEDGLEIVKNQRVDIIFLDYNIPPGMNGFQFIEHYRGMSEGQTAPIIMISTDMAINQFAVSNGLAKDWLVKIPTRLMVENVLRSIKLL